MSKRDRLLSEAIKACVPLWSRLSKFDAENEDIFGKLSSFDNAQQAGYVTITNEMAQLCQRLVLNKCKFVPEAAQTTLNCSTKLIKIARDFVEEDEGLEGHIEAVEAALAELPLAISASNEVGLEWQAVRDHRRQFNERHPNAKLARAVIDAAVKILHASYEFNHSHHNLATEKATTDCLTKVAADLAKLNDPDVMVTVYGELRNIAEDTHNLANLLFPVAKRNSDVTSDLDKLTTAIGAAESEWTRLGQPFVDGPFSVGKRNPNGRPNVLRTRF